MFVTQTSTKYEGDNANVINTTIYGNAIVINTTTYTGAPDGIWDWYGRAQRYVTRARSARAPKGGSGGPPPEFFLK